jgi:short-subunit dehydrogenase
MSNILITGASRGIGYAVVKKLTFQGDHHILAMSRNIIGLEILKEDCDYTNLRVKYFNLEDEINLPKIKELVSEFPNGKIDILINNAGVLINKPFEEFNLDDMLKIFHVNFFSAAELIRNLIPYMGKNSKSHVVNISSMGGFQGSSKFSGLSVYSASKAALSCLTECLAEEFKERNISFNCLALGAVQTEMLAEAFPGYKAPLLATEMADYIADFALNGNRFFNGKVIPVSVSTP